MPCSILVRRGGTSARKWDIAYMRKVFPDTVFVENKGQDHAEFFTLHPEEFCEQMEKLIVNRRNPSSNIRSTSFLSQMTVRHNCHSPGVTIKNANLIKKVIFFKKNI